MTLLAIIGIAFEIAGFLLVIISTKKLDLARAHIRQTVYSSKMRQLIQKIGYFIGEIFKKVVYRHFEIANNTAFAMIAIVAAQGLLGVVVVTVAGESLYSPFLSQLS